MKRATHGLTLLEVVLAIALLAALAVVALPILVDATRASAPKPAVVEPARLREWLAEQLAIEGTVERVRQAGTLTVPFGDAAARSTATLRWITGGSTLRANGWIEAQLGDVTVVWFVAPDEEESGEAVATKSAASRSSEPPP